ncbi:MAG: hypothetical protein ABSB35_00510 [Bryobacteraceae bacterium]|jgi:hypothetical protein
MPLRLRLTYRALTVSGTLLVTACACAQDVSFWADVKVVNLLATVRDRDGRIVKDLTREDFNVQEDGRPQSIRYFFAGIKFALDHRVACRHQHESGAGSRIGANRQL